MYYELYLTITNECQLRCPHCYKNDYGESLININDIKNTLIKYPSISIVILYGGEPLLEKYIHNVIDIYKYLKENGKTICCVSNLCFNSISEKQEKIIYGVDELSTSWNPSRFTEIQYDSWLSNVKKISEKRDINLLVTLTKDLIDIDFNEIYNKIDILPFKTIKFEPYIGEGDMKPKNKDVDEWLNNYFSLCLKNNNVKKYTLFEDIINSIKDNTNYGIFNRKCANTILTLKPNGEIINCPNMTSPHMSNTIEKMKQLSYNKRCFLCEFWKFCNGSCPLINFDDDYCCGYPQLFKSINNFIH